MADQPVPVTTRLTLLSRVAYRGQEIAGARLRGLLALLAGDLRTGCSTDRLVDGLWPCEQPENPTKALQVLVSRARAQLGADVIASTPTGYRLALGEDRVDTSAVLLSASASARHSRAGDYEVALAHAAAGLALYEAAESADTRLDDPLAALRAERASTHRSLLRARALALSRLGRRAEAVEALTELVAERPRDEEVLLELLRCEAATVGPSAALARYEAYRLATLIEDTAWILSHFRPDPDLVEVTRTATTLSAIYTFLIPGPRRLRPLVTLRRLPPGPPNTVIRALAKVLSIAPEFLGSDPSALEALCESDEPVLAGIANGFASFLWENEGDLDSALKAARRILGPFENQETQTPWMRVLAHSRISELCMRVDQGDEAQRHLKAALGVQEEFGERSDAFGIRWGLVLTSLQLGAIDEAEHWLELAVLNQLDDAGGTFTYELSVRAEILLARGEVDAGLRLWRRVVDQLNSPESATYRIEPSGLDPWTLEVQAVTVVAHAHHGRLDLVEQLTGELPHKLSAILTNPIGTPLPSVFELPVCGALLLALGMVDLDRGQRSGDERATRSGVRMVALAERFRFPRNFQPTMTAARARHAAEHAPRSAYADAVSTYTDLGLDDLRAAAQTALRVREL